MRLTQRSSAAPRTASWGQGSGTCSSTHDIQHKVDTKEVSLLYEARTSDALDSRALPSLPSMASRLCGTETLRQNVPLLPIQHQPPNGPREDGHPAGDQRTRPSVNAEPRVKRDRQESHTVDKLGHRVENQSQLSSSEDDVLQSSWEMWEGGELTAYDEAVSQLLINAGVTPARFLSP